MQQIYSHTLNVLQFANNTILCQINVAPRKVNYYHGQSQPHLSFRWLHAEHWAEFDTKIEELLISEDFKRKGRQTFRLDPLVTLKVKKATVETLCHCLSGKDLHKKDIALALKCNIEYRSRSDSKLCDYKEIKHNIERYDSIDDDDNEYKPKPINSKADARDVNISSCSYVPYTPSAKNTSPSTIQNSFPSDIEALNPTEEQYSPKRIENGSPDIINSTPSPVPTYNPARIRTKGLEDEVISISKEHRSKDGSEKSKEKRHTSRQKEEGSSKNETPFKENKFVKDKHKLRDDNSSETKDKLEKQLTESEATKKSKRQKDVDGAKSLKKHIDLFGIDDNNDDDFVTDTSKTPLTKKIVTSTERSTKKKRKHNEASDWEKEKVAMGTWLRKKRPTTSSSSSNLAATNSSKVLVKPLPHISSLRTSDYADKMKKDGQPMESSRRAKEMLAASFKSSPEKVETLSLSSMSSREILNTFMQHKLVLDELFNKYHKSKHPNGHAGLDHFLVIGLVDNATQLNMMSKLSDEYENNQAGSLSHTHLYANVLMPEWIISIFMQNFKLTRDEAIKQIKGQEDYRVRMYAQNENSNSSLFL